MDDEGMPDPMDRRLDLIGESVREIREYVRQGNEYMQEARAATERHTRAVEDQRMALNQMNFRSERLTRQMLAELGDLRRGTQEMTASIREWRYEGVEEARAQRAALFAILDQLKGGGPATA
ncbi:MAG: hypothetical protein WKF42_09950 [Solirubrobacteraceae bacterium]